MEHSRKIPGTTRKPGILTIYMAKPYIPFGKSSGSRIPFENLQETWAVI